MRAESHRELPVGRNHVALVDAEDYQRLSRYRWMLGSLSDGTKWAYRYDRRPAMRGPNGGRPGMILT